ncbi:tyrosine-type recombinase/integrase [Streptomyces cinereoruber]|uniref:tyrosine-type recombinase/integrase n=1 Tax=Streptomyces cinereoruber TaxID=67260 RepID=UPI003636D827
MEADIERGTYISPHSGKTTVAAWAKTWEEIREEVADLSDRSYKSRLRAQILPHWGAFTLDAVTTTDFRRWEKQLKAEGYSDNYIGDLISTFRTMLDDAVKHKPPLIRENPIPPRKSGRRGRYQKKQKDDVVFPSPRQAYLVARNALELRGFSHFVLVLTAAYAAMRIGELAGLSRHDLILPDRQVRPRNQAPLGVDGFYLPDPGMWEQPKKGSRIILRNQSQYIGGSATLIDPKYQSARELIIPPFLADLLHQLISSHKNELVFLAPKGGRLLIGGEFYSDTFHPIVGGRPPKPSSRGHAARPGIRPVLGLTGMTPHGLRHAGKVWLDEEGRHPRVAIEERMGHEVPGVEGTYSHTTLGMELAIAETLERLWWESLRPVLDVREYGPIPSGEVVENLISQNSPKRRKRRPPKRTTSTSET